MKFTFSLLCLALFPLMSFGQEKPSEPLIPLFENSAPGEKTELEEKVNPVKEESTGLVDRVTSDVSHPTLEIFPALNEKGKPLKEAHRAILVCPGGGYNILSYDKEGVEVAQWFQERGVTAAVLKYRVPRREGQEKHVAALQDAQRAMCYLRANHQKLNINPQDIGIIGFSAGAHLSVMTNVAGEKLTYPAQDDVDKESPKPNFTILVYPAYLEGKEPLTLAPEVVLPKEMGPTYILQTADDHAFMPSTLAYYFNLHKNNYPVEMHMYPHGAHGFGWRLRHPSLTTWKDTLSVWLKDLPVKQ